jgi:hypothetical protein
MTEDDESQGQKLRHIGNYALAFIDVLSQKEHLSKITELPKNEEERESFIEKWRNTLGVIARYRSMFAQFFDNFSSYKPPAVPGRSPELTELQSRLMKCEIKKNLFSDLMIYYVSLMNTTPDRLPITSILSLMSGCAGTFLIGLSQGIVCRGGLEVGLAGEFFDGELYGPALYQAYQLESERAQYPRIVVGQKFVDYIESEMKCSGPSIDHLHRRIWAEDCAEWIVTDVDGAQILDYAGVATKKAFPKLHSCIEPALKFVSGEWEKFREKGDTKLAERYFLLHTYLSNRSEQVWNIAGGESQRGA